MMGGGNSIICDADFMLNIKKTAEEKMEKIGESIVKMTGLIDSLDENAMLVKSEIQENIAAHMSYLRRREIQLLRQVDALISHQKLHLQMKLAQLYQMEGCLQGCSTLFQRPEMSFNAKMPFDVDGLTKDVRVQKLKFHTRGHCQLQLDIERFGQVDTAKGMAGVFNLPEEEDYGDGDHHVLHKTLQDPKWQSRVCFKPYSVKIEDWLRSSPTSNKNKTLGISCCQQTPEKMEIENLDKLACMTEDQPSPVDGTSEPEPADESLNWLVRPKPTTFEKLQTLYPVNVSINCRANEKCQSFGECICEVNCAVAAVQDYLTKSDPTKTICQVQDEVNQAIKECCRRFDCLQTDDLVWLRQESTSQPSPPSVKKPVIQHSSRWLREYAPQMDVAQEKNGPFIKKDVSKWLIAVNALSDDERPKNVFDKNSNVKAASANKLALKRSYDEIDAKDNKRRIRDMFSAYLQPIEINSWLVGH